MSEARERHSDLIEVIRRNGDFRKNYGTFIGAFLYLRSLSVARRRPFSWAALILGLVAAVLPWAARFDWRFPL